MPSLKKYLDTSAIAIIAGTQLYFDFHYGINNLTYYSMLMLICANTEEGQNIIKKYNISLIAYMERPFFHRILRSGYSVAIWLNHVTIEMKFKQADKYIIGSEFFKALTIGAITKLHFHILDDKFSHRPLNWQRYTGSISHAFTGQLIKNILLNKQIIAYISNTIKDYNDILSFTYYQAIYSMTKINHHKPYHIITQCLPLTLVLGLFLEDRYTLPLHSNVLIACVVLGGMFNTWCSDDKASNMLKLTKGAIDNGLSTLASYMFKTYTAERHDVRFYYYIITGMLRKIIDECITAPFLHCYLSCDILTQNEKMR